MHHVQQKPTTLFGSFSTFYNINKNWDLFKPSKMSDSQCMHKLIICLIYKVHSTSTLFDTFTYSSQPASGLLLLY